MGAKSAAGFAAGSFLFRGLAALGEDVEDVRQQVGRDADAGVAHAHQDVSGLGQIRQELAEGFQPTRRRTDAHYREWAMSIALFDRALRKFRSGRQFFRRFVGAIHERYRCTGSAVSWQTKPWANGWPVALLSVPPPRSSYRPLRSVNFRPSTNEAPPQTDEAVYKHVNKTCLKRYEFLKPSNLVMASGRRRLSTGRPQVTLFQWEGKSIDLRPRVKIYARGSACPPNWVL